jgi:geranylgeranyl pyrophosphate synthase
MTMQLNPRIMELIRKIDEPIQSLFIGRTPAVLYQPMVYVLGAGGKRIRPLLLALSCQSIGGRLENCLDAAVAVELLHTFTLVHDDIMDHDDLRRGLPTVHKKWDEATAILTGDGLVTAAYASLLRTRHPELFRVLDKFTEGLLVLCEGQALDKAFEIREDVTIDEYFDMIGKKTAKLIEMSCEVGGILGNGTEDETGSLGHFGFNLGSAFQIQDDLLDVVSKDEILGKPVGSDISGRKKTFLSTHFLSRADEPLRNRFRAFWGKSDLSALDVEKIKTLFSQTGTLNAAREAIEHRTRFALGSLERIRSGQSREDLKELALALLNRDF